MHGLSLMWCCVSFQIIALVFVLHFIGKASKEAYPGWLKWIAYLLLLGGFLGLICSFASGCSSMMHHKEECQMMGGACPAMKGCEGMKGCSEGDMKACHEGMMKGDKEGKGDIKCCKGGDDDDDAHEKGEHHDSTKVKK